MLNNVELQNTYEKSIFSALKEFQFVESVLRRYITISYDVIRLKIQDSDTLHYDFYEKDIAKWGLHRLATQFKKLCKNQELNAKFKSVVEARNQLAHDAFFQNFSDQISGISNEELHKKSCAIYAQSVKASKIVTALLRELKVLELEYEQLTKQPR